MLAAVRCTETDQKGLKIAAAAATATAVTAFFYIPLYSSKLVTELTPPALNSKAGFRDKTRRAELRLRAELCTAASACYSATLVSSQSAGRRFGQNSRLGLQPPQE